MNLSLLSLHFRFLFKITSVGDKLTAHDAKELKLAFKTICVKREAKLAKASSWIPKNSWKAG